MLNGLLRIFKHARFQKFYVKLILRIKDNLYIASPWPMFSFLYMSLVFI